MLAMAASIVVMVALGLSRATLVHGTGAPRLPTLVLLNHAPECTPRQRTISTARRDTPTLTSLARAPLFPLAVLWQHHPP